MFNSALCAATVCRDSQLDTIQQRLQQASTRVLREAAGGEGALPGDANLTDEQIAKLPFALYRQGYEYYWKPTRTRTPRLNTHYKQSSGFDEL